MARFPSEVSIECALDEPTAEDHLRARVARAVGASPEELPALVLRKRAIDARRGRVRFHLTFELGEQPATDLGAPHPREVGALRGRENRVVIVGDGPAGMFCAYELARQGIGCVVVDRGKQVQPRRHDLKGLNRRGEVDVDSNYCFGEGGAGTYSDGKLYTRAHKRGNVRDVIEILARHGAPTAILTDARPHIGSNRLPQVVTAMRETLEQVGVQFRFGARVVDLLVEGEPRRAVGVRLADGSELAAEHVVLATGHSASDVYVWLAALGVPLEPKPFAVGVRIEHPQALIDRIQYGRAAGHPALPAAPYRLSATVEERGVFSFCMCPGGFIVPASTVPGGLVVNGMSLSRRNSRYANSGLVVGVEPEDLERLRSRAGQGSSAAFEAGRQADTDMGMPADAAVHPALAGILLQRRLERVAFEAGGGMLRAPATRASDFVARRGSSTVPESSYLPGLSATDVGEVLDSTGLGLADRLRQALTAFDRRMRGYLTEEAVLVGVESRTSAPVRIPRDPQTLHAVHLAGLYPTGEGAGYAGGIMSAAMDGMRIARQIAAGNATRST